MVMQEPRPLAFLEGGEEGESRLNKIITKNNFYRTYDDMCFFFFFGKMYLVSPFGFPFTCLYQLKMAFVCKDRTQS